MKVCQRSVLETALWNIFYGEVSRIQMTGLCGRPGLKVKQGVQSLKVKVERLHKEDRPIDGRELC